MDHISEESSYPKVTKNAGPCQHEGELQEELQLLGLVQSEY